MRIVKKLFSNVNPKNVLKIFMIALSGAIVHGLANLTLNYPNPYPEEELFRLVVFSGVMAAIMYFIVAIKVCQWMARNQRPLTFK